MYEPHPETPAASIIAESRSLSHGLVPGQVIIRTKTKSMAAPELNCEDCLAYTSMKSIADVATSNNFARQTVAASQNDHIGYVLGDE